MLVIDRFEGGFAVCEREGGAMADVKRAFLPKEAREGDVIILSADGSYIIDEKETARRRSENAKLQRALFED